MGRAAPQLNDRAEKDRAHALALKGKYDDAIRIYRALLKTKPSDAALWQALGDVSRKRGLIDDAVNAYRTAAEHLEAQGHVPRARAALVVALQLAPGEPALVTQLNALRAVRAPVVTPPIPERVKRHLSLVPKASEVVEEVGDADILEDEVVSAASLLDELLEGLPAVAPKIAPVAAPVAREPALPPEIAAIFASPPTTPRAVVPVDELLSRRTGSNAKLKRPAKPNAPVPAQIAAIFAKPPAPAPARRRDTRPPPPVPSLIDDDAQDSGYQHVLDHVFSDDDELKTDPFCPPWEERSRETVVARPRRVKVPAYPR